MAKSTRKTNTEENSPDYLVRSKADFQQELEDRILKGEQLVKKQINSDKELEELKEEFSYWHDYNSEFLSRAFTKTKSKYYGDYTWTSSGGIFVAGIYDKPREPTFSEKVQSQKDHVAKYVTRLKKIKEKLPLIGEFPELKLPNIEAENSYTLAIQQLENIFSKFHKIVQTLRVRRKDRPALVVQDEYDVQYLLLGLLRLHFDDVREEDYSSSYAGGNSRVDFVLKKEKVIVETKMTNAHLEDKEVGSQLLVDIGRYKSHPDCQMLAIFVYDKGDNILNKEGLVTDLERLSGQEMKVRVFIEPR